MPPRSRQREITGADVVSDASRYLGVPYVYGGTNRQTGLDCSGLVLVTAEDLGISSCPRTSEEQWAWVYRISGSDAGAGDLVFFVGAELDPPPGHVGILISPGYMIDAPHTGTVVQRNTFTNGPGVNQIVGYGRMPGVKGSRSASGVPYLSSKSGAPNQQANAGAGVVGALAGWIIIAVALIVIVLAFVLTARFAFA